MTRTLLALVVGVLAAPATAADAPKLLRKRRTVRNGVRWQVAPATGSRIVGPIQTVTLRRATGAEAERHGCG